jgi:hypothetical protein
LKTLCLILSLLTARAATLVWDANPETNVLGYNVHFSSERITETSTVAAITARSGGTIRNNSTNDLGIQFTVATNATITHAGRWVLEGNSQPHTLKLLNSAGRTMASATVETAGKTAGQFEYVPLSSPVPVQSGADYFLLSSETLNGDTWYNWDQTVSANPLLSKVHSAFTDGQIGNNTGKAYGPVNFLASVTVTNAVASNWPVMGFVEGTSMVLTNISPDLAYSFYVTAVNSLYMTSAPSAVVTYSEVKPLPPLPAINVTGLAIAKRQGNFWQDVSISFGTIDLAEFGAENYLVKALSGSGESITLNATTSPAVFPSLLIQDYAFSAWVTNRDGISPPGRQIGITARGPGKPSNVQVIK